MDNGPKTASTEEIFARIGRFLRGGEVSDFLLRRIETDAERLKDSDPPGAYSALGVIAALRGNERNTRRWHQSAQAAAGGRNPDIANNYAASLRILGRVEESLEINRKAAAQNPGSADALGRYISACYVTGRFRRGQKALASAKRPLTDGPRRVADATAQIAQWLDQQEIPDSDLLTWIDACFAITRETGGGIAEGGGTLTIDGADQWLSFWVVAPVDGATAAKLCEQLDRTILSRPDAQRLIDYPLVIGIRAR